MRMACLALVLAGCSTLSGARPLERGSHEVGFTLGGPLLDQGAPIPLPNLVVGARSGLGTLADRPFDLGYGLNITGLPFGMVAVYGDLGWLVARQNGAVPAVTVRNKLFVVSNAASINKDVELSPRGLWGADQIDVIVSWQAGGSVFHATLGQVFDFGAPSLLLAPGIGASLDPGEPGGVTLQPELRWWGINQVNEQRNIPWVPSRPGALGVHVGLAIPLGGDR